MEDTLQKKPLILGIICLVVAAGIFVFADGARRIYSGGFFALLGLVLVASARRIKQDRIS